MGKRCIISAERRFFSFGTIFKSEVQANATLPDVCLTKVGKPIVPIPYGNNAKSADLASGTLTGLGMPETQYVV